jgi:hypothetical protein
MIISSQMLEALLPTNSKRSYASNFRRNSTNFNYRFKYQLNYKRHFQIGYLYFEGAALAELAEVMVACKDCSVYGLGTVAVGDTASYLCDLEQ